MFNQRWIGPKKCDHMGASYVPICDFLLILILPLIILFKMNYIDNIVSMRKKISSKFFEAGPRFTNIPA